MKESARSVRYLTNRLSGRHSCCQGLGRSNCPCSNAHKKHHIWKSHQDTVLDSFVPLATELKVRCKRYPEKLAFLVDLSRLPSTHCLAREAHIQPTSKNPEGTYHRVAGVGSTGMYEKAGPFPMLSHQSHRNPRRTARIWTKIRRWSRRPPSTTRGEQRLGCRHRQEVAIELRSTNMYQPPNQGIGQATSGQRVMLGSDQGHRSGGTEICSTQAAGT